MYVRHLAPILYFILYIFNLQNYCSFTVDKVVYTISLCLCVSWAEWLIGSSWCRLATGLCIGTTHKEPCIVKGKGRPYSITERGVPELIPVLGSQRAGDVSHKPGDRLPLLSARPAVTPATLEKAATSFAARWREAPPDGCEQFA